jgi:ABC-type cobalamin/Fe3+-siderophores transport system ATPase subunit
MNAAPGLHARGVGVSLGGRVILEAVDLTARPGELTAIVGPNGSGKTTLLRALGCLLDFSGDVREGDTDLRALPPAQRARRLAYLPQNSELRAALSVRQVAALGRYSARPGLFLHTRGDDDAVERALARVQLSALAERAYPTLSGGQKRLVLLARALATGAPTLLLDEPTASLDIRHALTLFELLGSLAREGYTIIVVLHDLDDVQRHAAHAVLLDRGRVQASGAPLEQGFAASAERTFGVGLVPRDRLGFRLPPAGAEALP